MITILASDDASGAVSFESGADVTLNEPNSHTTANSKAELRLIRGPGIFGKINVPFKITDELGRENITDLKPSSGYVTFADREVLYINKQQQ